MMLSAMFMMMRWITPVEAAYNRITLKFTDNDNRVEYYAEKKVVKASRYISSCISFNEANTAIIDKNTVTMDCSLQVFSMIDRMIDEENITEWEEIGREFNLNIVCEILRVFEYLLYDADVSDVIHKRLIEHIFPRIVFSVTNIEQRDEYMESNKEGIKREISDQMRFILPLYLQRYKLGVRKEEDMAVIFKDAENKNQKEVLKSIEFSELRILPEALNSVIEGEVNTDENQRLGVLLWMFDVYYFGISTLDLSGYTLTDGLMGQLSAMEYLKTLDLRECSVELGDNCDWIGTGFKALEDLDISGVKINENVACILSKIENLKRLYLRGCLVELGDNCDWIGTGFKALEDLDISGEKIDRNMVYFLSKFENLRKLNLRRCLVELDDNCDWIGTGFKALEDLDISGVKIDENVACILSKFENLRKLNLRGCLVELGNDCDWIGSGFKVLEDLDISGVKIDENVACILSKIENLRRLNLRECLMKLRNDCNWTGNGFRLLNDLDISGVKIEDVFAGILCRTTSLKKLNMEKCFIKFESNLEFIREQKELKELRIGGNYLSEEHLNIIFSHENIEVLDMDSCTVDDMYIYGGKIESTEMLKEFNGRKIYIEEGEMRITLLETDDECSLKGWKTYDGRIMFFSDDGEMKVNLSIDEKDDTNSDALERGTKIWRLSELNGSQVFVEGDREIRIVLPQNSSILDELREFTRGEVYFTGKGNGKMNFLDVMKSKGFMKNVKEYNCGQVYFSEKQIEVILSHKGLKKLNMRQCGLESKAIMKIKDKSTLMELDLSNNNIIGENDMIHIIKECPNLRKLNMSKCRMLVIGDFNEIPILERLEEFNIGGNKLNCKCIKHIVKHRKLLRLNLEGCGLVEDDLKGIDNLKGLKELFIGDNLISRKDLDRIFKLKELEVLNMFNSKQFNMGYKKKVNIDGIEALSKLKVLDLRNNRLHEKNINEIFELNELRDLRIEDYWAYCGMLRNISNLINLEKLSIWGFRIDENDMEGITSLKNLKELNMLQCYISGEKAFDNIGKLNDSLRLLSIEECNVRKEKCMKKLAELTNLRELRLVITVPFEIFYDVLEKLTCLRVLDIGIIDARKLIKDEKFPSGSLSRLEILKLEYTDVTDEFFKGLSDLVNLKELVNLREFSLTCSKVKNVEKLAIFDISVFPSGLRKLKLSGGYNCSFDLQSSSRKDAVEIFESLEELELHNIEDISEGIVSEINNCTKLRKLKLRIDTSKNFKADLKGISDIVTLEELVLEKVDLSSEDIVQLSCLEQLRRLKVCNCNLNDKYLNEIGKLKSLEALDIQKNNTISCSMNEILGLKNLRELSADVIWFDYDKQGDFEVVKGFERLKYDKWEIYRNNNRIGHENANFKDVLEKIGKEATINNWKGVTEWKCSRIKIDSVIFLAISSKLVFIESIYSHLDDELRIHEGETEILNNCQMIKKITLVNTEDRVFLPLSIVINIICDNSYLQVVDMSVDELNIDFADLLLECTRIHTIKFRVKKYTDGFFATLLKKPKETGLRSIEVYYCNYENENCKGKVICLNSKDSDIREKIIKYINEEDADAIIRAREENVFTSVYFYTA